MDETKQVVKDYVFDLMDAMTSPLITFETSWADTIPKRMKDLVPIARMKALMKNQELATYPEVVCYLYTRSIVAPMTSEWTDIYCFVSCMVCKHYFNEDHFESVQARRISPYLNQMLRELRRKIYLKRRVVLKEHLKTKKNASINAAITNG